MCAQGVLVLCFPARSLVSLFCVSNPSYLGSEITAMRCALGQTQAPLSASSFHFLSPYHRALEAFRWARWDPNMVAEGLGLKPASCCV